MWHNQMAIWKTQTTILLSSFYINVIVAIVTWAFFPNQLYKEKVVWIEFLENFKSVNIPVAL